MIICNDLLGFIPKCNAIMYTRGGQLLLLGGHFEKAALSGGPYLFVGVEARIGL